MAKGDSKRNLTLQLDEGIIQAAKELAVRRGTSVSGLVAKTLQDLVEADLRYQKAMRRALDAMHNAKDLGGRSWTREEIYEERLKRFNR